MPLISVDNVALGVSLGLWKIEDSVEAFFLENPDLYFLKSETGKFTSVKRRLEVLSVRALLCRMVGNHVVLTHSESGCPHLSDGTHVGISHTKGCASVIVSRDKRVSVDIEYISKRVERVADRLLRSDENTNSPFEILLHWCAKETLYKLYSADRLALMEMRLLSVKGNDTSGTIVAENIRRSETVTVNYCVSNGYVITYSVV